MLTVHAVSAFQRFAVGKSTRGQAEQNGGLPGSGKLSRRTTTPPVLRWRLRNPLAAHGSLNAADSCCQNIISIWPYTITARQHVLSVPPVSETSQMTVLMNGADIIPVITGCCILLPE